MKVFLAGTYSDEIAFKDKKMDYLLESFYYIKRWQIERIPELKMFLLDSGAFTFMNGSKKFGFEKYLDEYIRFINQYDIKNFFELDVDSITGYEEVLEMRKKLERETSKKCIPVWHKSRGMEEFVRMCDEYEYVAIGGIVTKEITKEQYKFLPWFVSKAHEMGCQIHGLGFTNTNLLPKIHFDSVDSTAWVSGRRFGQIFTFRNGKIEKAKAPVGKKTVFYKKVDERNISEWIKYQKYADVYL